MVRSSQRSARTRAADQDGSDGSRSWRARNRGLVGVAAAAALTLAACSSSAKTPTPSPTGGTGTGGASSAAGKVGGTLTVVTDDSPQTLDPAKAVQNDAWFTELAYEPLIVRNADGTLAPGLATSWNYVGTGNTTFVLHLRSGVKFSDGTPLTATTVVDDLRYVVASKGQMAPFLAGDTFTATDPLTVTIKAAAADPNFPQLLIQDYVIGGMVSGPGLASPTQLGTKTLGAGPYVLDPGQTVTGDHYTYLPNPNYYDPSAVHWKKVVVKVVADVQSVLTTIQTGGADVAQGDPQTQAAAKKDGLTIASSPLLWSGVVLADRGGKLSKPLADARVRQALNYGTDRTTLVNALFNGIGTPTDQMTVPGGYGYDASLNSTYPYNTTKAKQLLTAAGYPNGFTLKIVTPDYQQLNLMAQALKQQWQQIGVNLQITDDSNANQYDAAAFGGQFPAFMTSFGAIPIWMEGPSLFMPPAAFNPFHSADPTLTSLFNQEAVTAAGSAQTQADQKIEGYLVQQGWFVPVVATGLPYYARSTVTGISTSATEPLLDLYDVQPAD